MGEEQQRRDGDVKKIKSERDDNAAAAATAQAAVAEAKKKNDELEGEKRKHKRTSQSIKDHRSQKGAFCCALSAMNIRAWSCSSHAIISPTATAARALSKRAAASVHSAER